MTYNPYDTPVGKLMEQLKAVVEHCESCGESWDTEPIDAQAEIVRNGQHLIVHAECMREGDELA